MRGSMVIGSWMMLGVLVQSWAVDTAFFEKANCTKCHDAETKKGGLDLTALSWQADLHAQVERWTKLYDRVERGEMPPPAQPRPMEEDLRPFLQSLEQQLHEHSAGIISQSGRTALRRLNRTEYEYTVQDLLGSELSLQRYLPDDPATGGFETVAEGLRFSALQIEKYLEASEAAINEATRLILPPSGQKKRFTLKDEGQIKKDLAKAHGDYSEESDDKKHHRSFRDTGEAVAFFSNAWQLGLQDTTRCEHSGTYRIRFAAKAIQDEGKSATLQLYAHNHKERRYLGNWEIPPKSFRVIETMQRLDEGFFLQLQPYGLEHDPRGQGKDIHLYAIGAEKYAGIGIAVPWMEIEGPLQPEGPSPSLLALCQPEISVTAMPKEKFKWQNGKEIQIEVTAADPAAALAAVLSRMTSRALRRPMEPDEAAVHIRVAQQALTHGQSLIEAYRVGLQSLLISAPFLLFEEKVGPLDSWALASRLSYFLWSTAPDDELRRLAAADLLTQPTVLRAQAERLLADPRAERFINHFTTQWLGLQVIDATTPDQQLYPEFDQVLQLSMVGETQAFFREILKNNLPVQNFIHSDFIMVNRRLAEHYGLENIYCEDYQRVSLPAESLRGGLLGQAAICKITANGTVTSPVVRGTWVMKRLLGQPPFPPPPVPAIEPDTRGARTVRELLDQHRSSDSCNSCHRRLDPPGFAMEQFDVIGGFREKYRSLDKGEPPPYLLHGKNVWQYKLAQAVDATGQVDDGSFTGIRDFKQLLLKKSSLVTQALAGKLISYSTGAIPTFADRREIKAIAERAEAAGGGLKTLILEVISSELFRHR